MSELKIGHEASCTQRSKTSSKYFASFETGLGFLFLLSYFYDGKLDSLFFFGIPIQLTFCLKSDWKVCLKIWEMKVCDDTLFVSCSDQFYTCLSLAGSALKKTITKWSMITFRDHRLI